MRHGSEIDPPNRFESVHRIADLEHLADDPEELAVVQNRKIEFVDDSSESIVSENRSPDIPFRYSLNPYRGCVHGCAYCYARPTHEYLGFNAGLDFETRIVVKRKAAELFRRFLGRPSWQCEPITFSGVTDCYQPPEREFELTRQCLQVASDCNQPISIITKNALVTRDLDLLQSMASRNLIHVYLSITTLDPALARAMEPRTSIPAARLRAVRDLSQARVPVGVMMAPLIPGLNDSEIPQVLTAAREAGARVANTILLRLPLTVEPVFREWLERTQPERTDRILGRIQATREGKLNSSRWGERMTGTGEIADQIRNLFRLFRKKLELDRELPAHDCRRFKPPVDDNRQLRLF